MDWYNKLKTEEELKAEADRLGIIYNGSMFDEGKIVGQIFTDSKENTGTTFLVQIRESIEKKLMEARNRFSLKSV